MRKDFFNNDNSGYFTHAQKRETPVRNPMTDPSMMTGQCGTPSKEVKNTMRTPPGKPRNRPLHNRSVAGTMRPTPSKKKKRKIIIIIMIGKKERKKIYRRP